MRGLLLCFTVLVPVFGLSMTGRLNAQDQPEAAEDVEQRGLLRKIEDTRELLAGQKWLEATERFDEAWALACEGDDAMLDQRGADVRQLAPGQTDLMAGGKARLEDLYRSAPDAFRTEFSRQFDQVARQKILAAIETNDLESLRTLAARYQFAAAARQGEFPGDALLGGPLGGEAFFAGDTVQGGPTPLGPILRPAQANRQQTQEKEANHSERISQFRPSPKGCEGPRKIRGVN
jgi:hypothetical protein